MVLVAKELAEHLHGLKLNEPSVMLTYMGTTTQETQWLELRKAAAELLNLLHTKCFEAATRRLEQIEGRLQAARTTNAIGEYDFEALMAQIDKLHDEMDEIEEQ